MTQRSTNLKKRPDPKKILTEARKAVSPDLQAAKSGEEGHQEPRKRGRQPGIKFPEGYKKPLNTPKPAEDPKKPAAADPVKQNPPGDQEIFNQNPQADPRINFNNGFEIDVRDSVEMLVEVAFNQILIGRGEHWRLTPEKVKALAAPLTDIIDELLPGIANNKWTYRIGAIAAVMGPALVMDAMIHPETYQWLNIFKKKNIKDAREPEPQAPDKEQPHAGPGPQGPGENLASQAHPQAA